MRGGKGKKLGVASLTGCIFFISTKGTDKASRQPREEENQLILFSVFRDCFQREAPRSLTLDPFFSLICQQLRAQAPVGMGLAFMSRNYAVQDGRLRRTR